MSESSRAIWTRFDGLVAEADSGSPWCGQGLDASFQPDLSLLSQLLWVPIAASAPVSSGLHAKALDVWLAHELRRAGFAPDEVWPRATTPRVLPRELGLVLEALPASLRSSVSRRLMAGVKGAVSADASVLGSTYYKQVDVVMAQWARGPEVLISSKSMHSSLANNAFNRIEESFGDAHNLRARHPLAAIGYVLLIRGEAIRASQASAERLVDLVAKLGKDPAGYDSTAVVVADWGDPAREAGRRSEVDLHTDAVPPHLRVDRFLKVMVEAVLERTPVDTHVRVREMHDGAGLQVSGR